MISEIELDDSIFYKEHVSEAGNEISNYTVRLRAHKCLCILPIQSVSSNSTCQKCKNHLKNSNKLQEMSHDFTCNPLHFQSEY